MISNLAWILIFLSVCGIVTSGRRRVVDCRKYVFAPVCRGVAAKRDLQDWGNYDNTALFEGESIQHLLRDPYSGLAFLGAENDGQGGMSVRKENEFENSANQERMNTLLKLLFDSRSNSERDYSSAPEYENFRSIPSDLRFSRD